MYLKKFFHIVMMLWITLAAACNPAQPVTVSGCEGKDISLQKYGGAAFQSPEVIASDGGVLDATLEVRYGDNQIAGCPVHLRSYNGKLVGPTLRAKPGDKIIIHLKNMLPANPPIDHQNMNIPHDFNTTNLHTHGLHVSPEGISDNVLRKMPPPADGSKEADYEVEIEIPADHPTGTFWYHPHVHGSTAIQVSSGMGGALIIEGGLDQVPEIEAAAEKIFVFQQISYDTQGQIENFHTSLDFQQWEKLHRQHTINGQLYPTLTMRPGEVQRWRLIHGGVAETIMATIYGPDTNNTDNMSIERIKQLPGNPLHEIAVDGLALGKIDDWPQVELQPGYRSDVLVKFEKTGTYYLIDEASDGDKSLRRNKEPEKFLARIQVAGDRLNMPLPEASKLVPLKPFKDIDEQKDITGHQTVEFCLCEDKFTINGNEFDPGQVRKLKLNAVEEWRVYIDPKSVPSTHPFHIHVNPFQVARTGPDGKLETVWKDTFLITSMDPNEPHKLFMHYKDFAGKFVLHCHILDHEDQGMMEMIKVFP